MKKFLLLAASFLAVLAFSCSKDPRVETDTSTAETIETVQMTPKELGEKIGTVYVKALEDVTELIKDRPEIAEVRPAVEELKEANIRVLVELGSLREAMDQTEKGAVDMAILSKIGALSESDWYETYTAALKDYLGEDREFYELLSSFNIIGQYANFDLLKQQEPDEAKRLGIE
ncbi:hypothetical protein JW890_07335 [candidate division WOR-3 bacterium]|nr:hypothetical protein [candidate division WOR-3 bacterium]